MRYILLLALAACSTSNASKLDEPAASSSPRNFVCERVAVLNAKTECKPELSGVGDLSTHTARVTLEKATVVCGLNAGQLAMVCGPLEAPQPVKKDEPVAPAPSPGKE
jgi:hypothetical protein